MGSNSILQSRVEKGYLYWLFRELLNFLVAMKQSVLVFFNGWGTQEIEHYYRRDLERWASYDKVSSAWNWEYFPLADFPPFVLDSQVLPGEHWRFRNLDPWPQSLSRRRVSVFLFWCIPKDMYVSVVVTYLCNLITEKEEVGGQPGLHSKSGPAWATWDLASNKTVMFVCVFSSELYKLWGKFERWK